MQKHFLLSLLCLLLLSQSGMGQELQVSEVFPSTPAGQLGLVVCNTPGTVTFNVFNTLGNPVNNVLLRVSATSGTEYVLGSVTSASESNVSNLQAPVFDLGTIAGGATVSFTADFRAKCAAIAVVEAGAELIDFDYSSTYTGAGTGASANSSNVYQIEYGSLSFVWVSNQNVSISGGSSTNRTVRVVNGGFGRVAASSITLTDAHGAGLTLNSVSPGTLLGNTITFSAADLASVGNGDGFLDQGEAIILTENVTISGCSAVPSTITATWGCDAINCDSDNTNANVVPTYPQPSLAYTSFSAPTNTCFGNLITETITITNSGGGDALNTHVRIWEGRDYGMLYGNPGSFDMSSVSVQIGAGAPISLTPYNVVNETSGYSVGQAGDFMVDLPTIPAGQAAVISFSYLAPCPSNACGGNYYEHQHLTSLNYQNNCGSTGAIPTTVFKNDQAMTMSVAANNPSDVSNGEAVQFKYIVTDQNMTMFTGTGYIEQEFVLSPEFIFSGNTSDFFFEATNGAIVNSTSVTQTGPYTYRARFPVTGSSYNRGTFKINTTVDCAAPGATGGVKNIAFNLFLNQNGSCACTPNPQCINSPVNVHCPSPCPAGLAFTKYGMARLNYGLPDNDNNSLPDGSGSLDFNKIRSNWVQSGDTLVGTARGIFYTNGTTPLFNNAYLYTEWSSFAAYMTPIDAQVTVYDNSATPTFTCNNVPATLTGTRVFVDFSPSVLGTCAGAFSSFDQDDSVVVKVRYKINDPNPGDIITINVSNDFYASVNPNPSATPGDKYQCDNWGGVAKYVDVYEASNGGRTYNWSGCSGTYDDIDYYLGYYPCCSNYAGGNYFVFEYRPVTYMKYLVYTLPAGWAYSGTYDFTFVRSAGSGNRLGINATADIISLSPPVIQGDSIKFDLQPLYDRFGGPLPISDEGWYWDIRIDINPTCATPAAGNGRWRCTQLPVFGAQPIYEGFKPVSTINYGAAAIALTTIAPTQAPVGNIVSWDVDVSNSSLTFQADNVFLANAVGNVSIQSVQELPALTSVPSSGGIFQLGNLTASQTKSYRINAIYNNCNTDSLKLRAGWNCGGYPANLAAYTCQLRKAALTVQPPQSELQITDATSPDSVDLCVNKQYLVKVKSTKTGNVYNPQVRIVMPSGLGYVAGSAEMLYPAGPGSSGTWVSIPDPTLVSGTTYNWNVASFVPDIATNGLRGVGDLPNSEFHIRFNTLTDCNFMPGARVTYRASGTKPCNSPVKNVNTTSAKHLIKGAGGNIAQLQLASRLSLSSFNPCTNTQRVRTVLTHNGGVATTTADRYRFVFPDNKFTYAGNFVGVHNAPAITSPSTFSSAGQTYLSWELPAGIIGTGLGDSIVFEFDLAVAQNSLFECGQDSVSEEFATVLNLACNAGSCTVTSVNQSKDAFYTNLKADPVLSGYSVSESGGVQQALGTITNNGTASLAAGSEIVFYCDTDNSGTVNGGDVNLGTYTIPTTVGIGGTHDFSQTWSASQCVVSSTVFAVMDNTTAANCICNSFRASTISTLPVDFLSFEGNWEANDAKLNWTTASEINNDRFEVERATEAGNFVKIGELKGKGNSNQVQSYQFTDKNAKVIPSNSVQYRLRQVDFDGNDSYSKVVELFTDSKFLAQIFPNPANSEVFIQYLAVEENLNLTVSDNLGRIIYQDVLASNQELQKVRLDVSNWAKGMYIIRLENRKNKSFSFKLTVE